MSLQLDSDSLPPKASTRLPLLIASLAILSSQCPASAATMTDAFQGRPVLGGTAATFDGNSAAATTEIGEPDHDGDRRRSLWAAWTAPGSGWVVIDTLGSSFNTVMAVYSGERLTELHPVALNDDFSEVSTASKVRFPTKSGMVYSIAVDGRFANSTGSGSAVVNIQFTSAEQPNAVIGTDAFGSRPTLEGGLSALGVASTRFAGIELDESPRYSDSAHTCWWRWVAPSNGIVTIDSLQSAFDTVLTVYVGTSLNDLSEVALNDDATNVRQSRLSFRALAGQEYQLMLDGRYNNSTGRGNAVINLALAPDIEPGAVPGSDTFALRGRLEGQRAEGVAMNNFFGLDPSEPDHGSDLRRTVWWEWTAPAHGLVRISTEGSTPVSDDLGAVNTMLVVYSGSSLTQLQRVAANDDVSNARWSEVRFTATRGTRYQLMVDGRYGNTTGVANVRIRVEQAAGPGETLAVYPAAEVEVPGALGVEYQVQSSIDLITWTDVGEPLTGAGRPIRILDSYRATGRKFYRYLVL